MVYDVRELALIPNTVKTDASGWIDRGDFNSTDARSFLQCMYIRTVGFSGYQLESRQDVDHHIIMGKMDRPAAHQQPAMRSRHSMAQGREGRDGTPGDGLLCFLA